MGLKSASVWILSKLPCTPSSLYFWPSLRKFWWHKIYQTEGFCYCFVSHPSPFLGNIHIHAGQKSSKSLDLGQPLPSKKNVKLKQEKSS